MNKEISDNILKSNTSLVGIVCKDGVVMAADKRSTAGGMIMNKNSKKTGKPHKNKKRNHRTRRKHRIKPTN